MTSVRRRSSLRTSSASPVRDGNVAHADCFTDLRLGKPEVVRLEGEPGSLVGGPLDGVVGALELFQQLSCARFVGDDLLGGAHWSTGASFGHASAPGSRVSVEPGVASQVGTWNDPTRISLGSDVALWVPVGTSRNLPVACRGVEDDPCESCLQAIVTPRSLQHLPDSEPDQLRHSPSFTRRNTEMKIRTEGKQPDPLLTAPATCRNVYEPVKARRSETP